MLKLTLEAIELVDAIARHGSFAAAAARLNKVPSTISYAVGKLEEQLGMLLFERNGPRVTLTSAGDEMLKEGRWLLGAASDLESRMRQIATGYESELRLVHDSLIPTQALIGDIRAFEDLRCGTRLRIGCEALTGAWEALREGRADIVIAAGEGPAGGGYQAVTVGSLDFAFCVAPTHPLTRLGRPLQRGDLLALQRHRGGRQRPLPVGPHRGTACRTAAHHRAQHGREDRLPGRGPGPRPPAARLHRRRAGARNAGGTAHRGVARHPSRSGSRGRPAPRGERCAGGEERLNRSLVPALLPRSGLQ